MAAIMATIYYCRIHQADMLPIYYYQIHQTIMSARLQAAQNECQQSFTVELLSRWVIYLIYTNNVQIEFQIFCCPLRRYVSSFTVELLSCVIYMIYTNNVQSRV